MTHAILYVRVSTQKQVQDGHSLAAQEARLRDYAVRQGFDQVQLVVDEGLSGSRTDRPGFVQVMQAVRDHAVNAVVVVSLSRFARNTVATVQAIEVMNKAGVSLHSLSEQLDTSTPVGRFFVTVLASLAQLEREQVGERTRAVLQHRKSQGFVAGHAPFGFCVAADGQTLERDEREQQVIDLVKQLRAAGMTFRAIATDLTRRQVAHRDGRTSWTPVRVYQISKVAA